MLHFHYGPLVSRLKELLKDRTQNDIADAVGISRATVGNVISPRFVPGSLNIFSLVSLCNYCNIYLPSLITAYPETEPNVQAGEAEFKVAHFQNALYERYLEVKKNAEKIKALSGLPRSTMYETATSSTTNPATRIVLGCLAFIGDEPDKFFPRVYKSLFKDVLAEAQQEAIQTPEAQTPTALGNAVHEKIESRLVSLGEPTSSAPEQSIFLTVNPVLDVASINSQAPVIEPIEQSAPKLALNTQIPQTAKELRDYMLGRIQGLVSGDEFKYTVRVTAVAQHTGGENSSYLECLVTVYNVTGFPVLEHDDTAKTIAQAYHQFNGFVEGHFFSE